MSPKAFILVHAIHINFTMFFDEFSNLDENYNEILHCCYFFNPTVK